MRRVQPRIWSGAEIRTPPSHNCLSPSDCNAVVSTGFDDERCRFARASASGVQARTTSDATRASETSARMAGLLLRWFVPSQPKARVRAILLAVRLLALALLPNGEGGHAFRHSLAEGSTPNGRMNFFCVRPKP
jgi:hypothetical protein